MKKIWIIVVGSSLSLQSCFVAKDYKRPDNLAISSEYKAEQNSLDSSNVSAISWKDFFQDQILKNHIEKALTHNLDIRNAVQNVSIAEAYMKQAKAGYFPTFSVAANHTFMKTSANTQFGRIVGSTTLNQFDVTGTFAWEADVWGKIRSTKRGFVADYIRSQNAHQAVSTGIIASVANAYFNLLALEEQKKITLETIKNREESVTTNQELKTAGIVSEVAVNQNQALLVNAQAMLLDLENAIKLNENVLSVLLGENPKSIERSTFTTQNLNVNLSKGLPIELLQNRPDVRASEMALVKAFENVNVARSNFYPAVRINATGGLQSIDFAKLFDPKSIYANIVSGLVQPIYNRRALKTQKEVATAAQEQALIAYQKSIITATKEVSDALYNLENSRKKIVLKEQELGLYNQSIDFSEELLKNGMANYLEVITAKNNSLSTELGIINIKLQELNATVELYRALGGGWK